jgi:hypothetical protein
MYGNRLRNLEMKLSQAEHLMASLADGDRARVQRMIDLVRERVEMLRILTAANALGPPIRRKKKLH